MRLVLGSIKLGVSAFVDNRKGAVRSAWVDIAAGVDISGRPPVAFLLVLGVILNVIAPLGIILLGFDIPPVFGSLNSLRINAFVLGHLPLSVLLADRTAHYFVIYLNYQESLLKLYRNGLQSF